jgi:FYVE, RhoGEF and PH domain containing 5/6
VLTPSDSPNIASSTPTFTFSSFPSWQSTPALPLVRPPSLLMAIGVDDAVSTNARPPSLSIEDDSEQGEISHPAIRIKPASRPRSFLHILEDFQEESSPVTPSPSTSHFTAQSGESADGSSAPSAASLPTAATSLPTSTSSAPRNEDTTRRQQRFSLPTVGLQTTPVTARANAKGEGLAKRFSLVLGGGRTIRGSKSIRVHGQGLDQEAGEGTVKQSRSIGNGVAASRLADLLGKRKGA